ncbi:hypothetical protein Tco_1066519 [Tanacetum coccineum]|uniref:Uncharacterized protein n=1 Tax=Tanacetum coccineum TaxID=301880 RepID=A0ABQ5HC36_9ASTR
MTKSKSFNKSPKQRALYHALMESILEDEDAMDKGVAEKLKKRKPDDADNIKGTSLDQTEGTSKSQPKSTGKFAQAEKTVFETGDTQGPQNLGEDMSNTDEPPVVNVDPKDWFKKPERPPPLDLEWNKRELTQEILVRPAYNIPKGTCRSYVELDYNMEECYKSLTDQLDWNNPKGDRYTFDLSNPLPLVMSGNRQIVLFDYFFNNDLAYLQRGSTGRTYTTSLTKTKAVKYDLPGIEDMDTSLLGSQKTKVFMDCFQPGVPNLMCTPQRILAVTNVKVKEWYGYGHLEEIKVQRSDHDRTLISLHDTLKDMANNLEMGYTSVMSRRRWSKLDKKRSRIMLKDIDHQLLDRRLMRSLEKVIGERYYEEDPRLLQRTI